MNWLAVFENIGIFAIGSGLLVWLFRSLISQALARDIEGYKVKLATEHSVAIEKLKADLRAAAFEHETRFARLHERRVEILAELYKKLAITEDSFIDVLHPVQRGSKEDHNKRIRDAQVGAIKFFEFFNENRVFLDEDVCELIVTLREKLRRTSAGFAGAFGYEDMTPNAQEWADTRKLFLAEVPPLRTQIDARVRKMLGALSG
jgi:hypothetical protein